MPNHLHDLQNQWLNHLRQNHSASSQLAANPALDPAINVYRDSIKGFHLNALKLTFPTIIKILGDTYFRQLAAHYYQQQQLKAPNLNQYGQNFSACLTDLLTQRTELQDYPYLPDLATLEWQRYGSYYATDTQAVSAETLATIMQQSPDTIYFRLAPSIRILKTTWPLLQLLEPGEAEPAHEANNKPSQTIVIYREHFNVKQQYLDAQPASLLQTISEQPTLAALETRYAETAMQWLPRWIQAHWVLPYV